MTPITKRGITTALAAATLDELANRQGLVSKLIELNIDRLLDAEFEFDKLAQAQYP